MDNLYDSMGRKIIVDRTNGPWTPEGGYGGACHYEDQNITECISHRINLHDQCEIIENCTVEILTNTLTGETSVVWWRGGVEDRPRMEGDKHELVER